MSVEVSYKLGIHARVANPTLVCPASKTEYTFRRNVSPSNIVSNVYS